MLTNVVTLNWVILRFLFNTNNKPLKLHYLLTTNNSMYFVQKFEGTNNFLTPLYTHTLTKYIKNQQTNPW